MARTVIIIDDDPDDLDIMKQAVLEVAPSLQCISFIYPQEALRILLSNELMVRPEYIFIDMNMPVVTGDQCLKAIRADKSFERVTIAVYSTSMPEAVKEALRDSGANFVFEKPVRMRAYVEKLAEIIKV